MIRISKLHRWAMRTVARPFGRFRRDEGGIAAVEFALIVPIMMLMFLGAVEMSWAVSADRRVSQVAGSAGDLVARINKNIGDDEVKQIAQMSKFLLQPFDVDANQNLSIEVSLQFTRVADNDKSKRYEAWKCTYVGSTDALNCTCPTTPKAQQPADAEMDTLMGIGDSIVVAKADYNYRPAVIDFFLNKSRTPVNGTYKMSELLRLKPRALGASLILKSQGETTATTQCSPI
jgi:Flp pilus assembly pilin Flp